MNHEQQRQQAQLNFVNSGGNLELGNLDSFPLTLEQLKEITELSPYVIETFQSGLTAIVYHIRLDGIDSTLKSKRPESLVQNIDGQTSFLNEVQRRIDLSDLKASNPKKFQSIVDTQFASFQDGIILSPWIAGTPITKLTETIFNQIFEVIINLEINGLFEWDLCPGNILVDDNERVWLFDFGYMYPFEPKSQFNSNGLDTPLFHGIERFETRFFFNYLLQNSTKIPKVEQFELYKLEKRCALAAYQNKLQHLEAINATKEVLEFQKAINARWESALADLNPLKILFELESFRSHVLDLLDDIHGKYCSSMTIKKSDLIINTLTNKYELLKDNQCFFFGDEKLGKQQLISKYGLLKSKAIEYQLSE